MYIILWLRTVTEKTAELIPFKNSSRVGKKSSLLTVGTTLFLAEITGDSAFFLSWGFLVWLSGAVKIQLNGSK